MRIKSLLNRRNFLGSAGLLAGMLLNARRAFGLSAGGASDRQQQTNLLVSAPQGTFMKN